MINNRCLLIVMLPVLLFWTFCVPAPFAEIQPLSSALHVFPQVGDDRGNVKTLDRTLTNFLKVTMSEKTEGGYTKVAESTCNSNFRATCLRLHERSRYRTFWRLPFDASDPRAPKGKEFEIRFVVAGLEVGSIQYVARKQRGKVPIKFRIDNHPVIRAAVLYERGFTASYVAGVLVGEFSLSSQDTAQALRRARYHAVEVAGALRDMFSLGPQEAAQILKNADFSYLDVGLALRNVFVEDATGAAQILKAIGYSSVEAGTVLRDLYYRDAPETAQILRDVGYSSVQVGLVLRDVFAMGARDAAQMIKDIGYSEDDVMLALMDVYNTYLAVVDVMVTDWSNCANVPDDYTGLAWGGTPTNPYIPDLIGERRWSNDVNVGIGGTDTTIWVKYDLVPVTSDQPVLVDYGTFHWPYWEVYCPEGWQPANGTSSGRQGALTTGTEGDCYRNGLCVHYGAMNATNTFITNVGLSYTGGSEAACPAWGEANLGYWPMQADSYDIHKNCADDRWIYLCYGRGGAWPPMPMSIDVTDEEKFDFLATYAPRVWIAQNESYWPSSVEWAFPYLERYLNGTYYWLRTWEGVEGSEVLDFFRGCNGSSTSNPCTINDVPVYAFWVKKSTQVGEQLFDYVDLVYFFYYPYNRGKEVVNTVWESHVGDWEHVTVRLMWSYGVLTGWLLQPVQMYISAHDFGGIYDWATTPKINDSHPIVYSAWGSHGVWLTPGRHRYDEVCHPWPWCTDLVDWTSEGTAWDTWNDMEAFDYSLQQGLGGCTWPLWMGDDFTNPGACGNPSNPACGPIYRWGNVANECWSDPIGQCLLTTGPTGPVSKSVWGPGILK